MEPIEHLKRSISEGKHWYIALLEAIALWTVPVERYNGRLYQYLIKGEAFDWLMLAERLCLEIEGLVPEEERINLMFGKPPLRLSSNRFKAVIGPEKYRAFLNYFYGVVVEQALQFAVEIEIEKEHNGRNSSLDYRDLACQRIYGMKEETLLERFRRELGRPQSESIELSEFIEFTYWLFKYRFENCDSARVASDTRKGLQMIDYWGEVFDGVDGA
ncbi:MAG: hypothetical protein R6U89_09760 [Dehalococcoidia bacterium]